MFKQILETLKDISSSLRSIERCLKYIVGYIAKIEKSEQTTIRKNGNG